MGVKVGSIFIYRLAVAVCGGFFALRGGLRALTPENAPKTGGMILVSNHMSHLDPPALACALKHRRLLALAKEELFHHRAFGWLIGQIGAFPVKRGEADMDAMRFAMGLLEDGHSMIVFPEGTRGDGVTLLPLERGVALLAKKTGVPVVPAGIHGTQFLMPRGKKGVWRHRATVAFGEPFTWAEVATGANERENRERFAERLQSAIVEQCRRAGLDIKTAE